MKFIKITMSHGPAITLSETQAEALFANPQQLVMVKAENGAWSGRAINKAYIVSADRDHDAERDYRIKNAPPALPLQTETISPAEAKRIEQRRKEISTMLRV